MSQFARPVRVRPRAFTALAALGALGAVGAFTAALLGPPTVASAAPPHQTTVYYSLRDLSSDRGTRALYRRIVDAAEMVCPPGDSLDLRERAVSKECQREAIAHAVDQIGDARLAAVHARALDRTS